MSHSRVTPELRRWIITQIETGQTPEAVLEAMRGNGWPEGAALDVMERTLRMRVAQIKAAENAARHGEPTDPARVAADASPSPPDPAAAADAAAANNAAAAGAGRSGA